MFKNRDWTGGFICCLGLMFMAGGLMLNHERHGRAQITSPDTTGMISPVANSSTAPAAFITCNATAVNLTYINTTTSLMYLCDGTNWNLVKSYLSGTSGTITGTLLAAGGSDTGTVTVSGATAGMPCGGVTPTDGTAITGFFMGCTVTGSGANNVTVWITAPVLGTPPTKAYSFRIWP